MIKTNILLFSALAMLAVSSQASTVQQQHDWENQYVLAKNRMPSRSSFTPTSTREETEAFRLMDYGNSIGQRHSKNNL